MTDNINTFLQIHPHDNVLVALQDIQKGTVVPFNGDNIALVTDVAAKHKFTITDLEKGQEIYMYGVLVGKANHHIPKGNAITTENIHHAASDFKLGQRKLNWHKPEVDKFAQRTFLGYHRLDGSVGTANYWLVIPLVFCENRNIMVLKDALVNKLGYKKPQAFEHDVDNLINL